MASVCGAMMNLKTDADEILFAPESGKGASLTIRYKLPRR